MTSDSDPGSLKRGVFLLKVLTTATRRGLTLVELSDRTGIPHSSTHRILRQLIAERLVEHHDEERRYRLGPMVFELGVAGSILHDIRDLCDGPMRILTEATEDAVYLTVRSGFDSVVLHRHEGAFAIRAFAVAVGSRRPLGFGAGGLAILAAITEPERSNVIDRVAPGLARFQKITSSEVAHACAEASRIGAAITSNQVTLGATTMGVAFRDSLSQPIGALSVSSLTQRMSSHRVAEIIELLRKAAADIEKLIRAQTRGQWTSG